MFGNVTTKMSNWIDFGVLGGLIKTDQGSPNTSSVQQQEQSSEPVQQTYSTEKLLQEVTQESCKDDVPSPIGWVNSEFDAPEIGTPIKEKEGTDQPTGFVSTKAFEGAKLIGNFLFSAVNKAGKTVTEASAKIKKTVEENSLLGDFSKEQESFIKKKQAKTVEPAFPPWVGCTNEASVQEECLAISTDKRTFIRSPPAGVDFHFDYEVSYPVAIAALAEDANLEKMRFELVPKVISEENFWQNYFYRVSLIRQANELSSIVQEQDQNISKAGTFNVAESNTKLYSHEVGLPVAEQASADSPSHEFLSDTFHASSADLEEVQNGMKKLGITPDKKTEEEWERELEAELQDYEVVADKDNQQDSNWENQIDEMLDAEDSTDLK